MDRQRYPKIDQEQDNHQKNVNSPGLHSTLPERFSVLHGPPQSQVRSKLQPSKKSSVGMLGSNSHRSAAGFWTGRFFCFFLRGMAVTLAHFMMQPFLTFFRLPQG